MKRKQQVETEPHKCTLATIFEQGGITEGEYRFLQRGGGAEHIFERVEAVSRTHGLHGISGVFYALEANTISVGKCMQVVRRFLLSGDIEDYTPATAATPEPGEEEKR